MLEAFTGATPPETMDTKSAGDTAGHGALGYGVLSSDNSLIVDSEEGEVGDQPLAADAFVFDPDWLTLVAAPFDAGFSFLELGTSLTAEVQFDAPSAEGSLIGTADTIPIWGQSSDDFRFI